MDAGGREEVARVPRRRGVALVLGAALLFAGPTLAAEAGPACTGLPEAALLPAEPGDEACASVAGVRLRAVQDGIDYGGGAASVLVPCEVARNLGSLSGALKGAGVQAVRLLPACSRDTKGMLRVVANLHGRVLRINGLRFEGGWKAVSELSEAERKKLVEAIPKASRFKLVFATPDVLHVELGWEHTTPPAWLSQVREDATAKRLKPDMVDRAGWNARAAMPERMTVHRKLPHAITIHHSGEELPEKTDPRKRIRGLQGWTLSDRKWGDIPYHYTIDYEGRIYVNREERYVGVTNTAYDPDGHLLVHLLGNYDQRKPSEAQKAALVKVTTWLAYRYGVPVERILGHGEHADTACPGKNLQQLIDDGSLRAEVKARLPKAKP